MLLFIDTSDYEHAKVALVGEQIFIHEFQTRDLSEKLLPEIKKFLSKQKVNFKHIKKIGVVVGPGGFSRIRTGVSVANALAFGLKIPLIGVKKDKMPKDLNKLLALTGKKMTEPIYDKQPNITMPHAI